MEVYYAQRASAGLQVAEATAISPQAVPYPRVPGIWNAAQTAAWLKVTAAVHAAGGAIFLQLWHGGRVSHSATQPGGRTPVAPSAIAIKGTLFTAQGLLPFETPRALETDEIKDIVKDYRSAARNAELAGFDGIEIHSANGYLIDQFLNDQTNRRTDEYGGSRGNRMRLLLEVFDAVTSVWGSDRVGVRLSPSGTFMDCRDSDKRALYDDVVEALSSRQLAYLHLVEPTIAGSMTVEASPDDIPSAHFRNLYRGTLIVSGDHTVESGAKAIENGTADMVGYGRTFISNPDLPRRFELDADLAESHRSTYYSNTDEGYIDYPSLEDRHQYEAVAHAIEAGALRAEAVVTALAARRTLDLVASHQYYTQLRLQRELGDLTLDGLAARPEQG